MTYYYLWLNHFFFILTAIIPEIAPIIEPKIISFKRVLLNSKENPSKIEKQTKDKITYDKPITSPVIIPISLTFFIP